MTTTNNDFFLAIFLLHTFVVCKRKETKEVQNHRLQASGKPKNHLSTSKENKFCSNLAKENHQEPPTKNDWH